MADARDLLDRAARLVPDDHSAFERLQAYRRKRDRTRRLAAAIVALAVAAIGVRLAVVGFGNSPATRPGERPEPVMPSPSPEPRFAEPPSRVSVPSGVAWIRVPEGLEPGRREAGNVEYPVRTLDPEPWIEWFVERYPIGRAPRGWRYCGGGNEPDGMSRSWNRGEFSALLNVDFDRSDRMLLIIVVRDRFDDCEHRN